MQAIVLTDAAGRPVNEDAGGVWGDVAVVVDGAGVDARLRSGCRHSVAWYSHHLAAALLRHGQDARDLRAALARGIGEVRGAHAHECALAQGGPSATVAMARCRDDRLELLVLCDAAVLLRHRDGRSELWTDDRLDRLRPGRSGAEIEALRNVEGGFWVARHEERCAQEALCRTVATDAVERVHLVSDGVLRALDPVGSHDVAALEAELARDPVGALRRLRADEAALPAGRRPRELHDDATLVTLWDLAADGAMPETRTI